MDKKSEMIKRFPRLIAHMMCYSLGYFTPLSAAAALVAYREKRPYWCEWYIHMCGNNYSNERLVEIGRDVVKNSFLNRHRHNGYMSDYNYALKLVMAERKSNGVTSNMLAGWF